MNPGPNAEYDFRGPRVQLQEMDIKDQERMQALEENFKQLLYAEVKYNQEFGEYIGSKVLSAKWDVWRSQTLIRKVLMAAQIVGSYGWMSNSQVKAIKSTVRFERDDLREVGAELDSVYNIVLLCSMHI